MPYGWLEQLGSGARLAQRTKGADTFAIARRERSLQQPPAHGFPFRVGEQARADHLAQLQQLLAEQLEMARRVEVCRGRSAARRSAAGSVGLRARTHPARLRMYVVVGDEPRLAMDKEMRGQI
eukprot:SAG31_NODE_9437_length_1277_cov_1.800509_2_plen_123_part_00